MWELATHSSNVVFSICIALVFMFGVLETLLLCFFGGSQGFLEQFLPDNSSIKDPDVNFAEPQGAIQHVLDWLYIGRLPLLIWFIIFLTIYGLSGLLIQALFQKLTDAYLNAWIIVPACLFLVMPLVRFTAKILEKFLPKDETTAIYSEQLIGRSALIILGNARMNSPAQGKVYDQFNQVHYVLLEPEEDIVLQQGETVILTQQTKVGFKAILDKHTII